MRRRDFLKGIFGAAALAAVPAVVLRQIDELPPPAPPIDPPLPPTISAKRPVPQNGLLYIWDGERNELVGTSTEFSLNMHRHPIDVSSWYPEVTDYPTYMEGPTSWDAQAERIQWLIDPRDLFERLPTQLQCLMAKDDMKFCGNVYLTQLYLTAPLYEETTYGAVFEGTGELIMEA